MAQIRDVSLKIALAVALQAQKDNVAPAAGKEQTKAAIAEKFWTPHYRDTHPPVQTDQSTGEE